MKIPSIALPLICFLLILLWVYAACSKLMAFDLFRVQMDKQLLPPFLKHHLVYLLPPFELFIAVSLFFDKTRLFGFYLSAAALFAFSVYIGLAISKTLGRIPCSCGGIFRKMGWQTHLLFNTFFLLLTAIGIYIIYRERRGHREI